MIALSYSHTVLYRSAIVVAGIIDSHAILFISIITIVYRIVTYLETLECPYHRKVSCPNTSAIEYYSTATCLPRLLLMLLLRSIESPRLARDPNLPKVARDAMRCRGLDEALSAFC